ncbi:hypothetical protein [Arthrobacter sp. ISL-95]|nr:hypothetical protein [Arthrobacter sp. ISL-95]
MNEDRGYVGEVLDVRALGSFQAQDFVMEEAAPRFQFVVDGVEAF